MKNGTQLLFSALFRKLIEKKTLTFTQTVGILLVVCGLMCVCIASFLNDTSSFGSIKIGIFILVTVGFFGSLRNHYEQILCREGEYNANFVVGMRSFVSIFWISIIGIILLFAQQPADNKWIEFCGGIHYIFSHHIFLLSFFLFLLAIYGKNVTQMMVIKLSSALTRNLTMQFMPVGTWIMSLIFYYFVDEQYGEEWNNHSWIQLGGFILLLIGSHYYIKAPKVAVNLMQTQTIEKYTLN